MIRIFVNPSAHIQPIAFERIPQNFTRYVMKRLRSDAESKASNRMIHIANVHVTHRVIMCVCVCCTTYKRCRFILLLLRRLHGSVCTCTHTHARARAVGELLRCSLNVKIYLLCCITLIELVKTWQRDAASEMGGRRRQAERGNKQK